MAKHLRDRCVLWILGLLVPFVLNSTINPAKAESQPITLRLSTQSLPESPSIKSILHFKERVEAKSQGRLRIEIYDSAKLYSDGAIGQAVGSGAVDMGYVNLARYAEKSLIADAFELPFLFNTPEIEKAARAPGSEIRQLLEAVILSQMNSRVLWWVSEGQVVFFANGMSVADPEIIAGKNVRVVGPLIESAVKLCGGKPKTIGASDQVKAYEQRQVDVGMSSIATVLARKIFKSMDTITKTNHASAEFVVVINERAWQGLPQELKEIVLDAAHFADTEASEIIAEIEASAYRQLVDQYSAKVVGLTDDQLILWRICTSDVLSDFMERTGKTGQELMQAYGRLKQQPCCNKTSSLRRQ